MSGIFLRIHLVGIYTNRLPVFRWKAGGYDWILVDSIGKAFANFLRLTALNLCTVKR